MSEKEKGLYGKYEVKKITNPTKELDCIVLEFDDPNARYGIYHFAIKCHNEGYQQLAADIYRKTFEACSEKEWLELNECKDAVITSLQSKVEQLEKLARGIIEHEKIVYLERGGRMPYRERLHAILEQR